MTVTRGFLMYANKYLYEIFPSIVTSIYYIVIIWIAELFLRASYNLTNGFDVNVINSQQKKWKEQKMKTRDKMLHSGRCLYDVVYYTEVVPIRSGLA